jgi:AraC-like DNA-binding protein
MGRSPAVAAQALVPAAYVAELVALLGEEGVAPKDLLRGTDLKPPALAGRDALITNSDQLRIYTNALSLTRETGLGLRLGARLRLEHHGVVGHAMLCSDNLRQALHVLVRYTVLRGFPLSLHFREEGRVAVLTAAATIPLGRVYELVMEEALAILARGLPPARGPVMAPLEIRVDYPPPAHRAMYEQFFGCPVRFNADAVEYRFSADTLDDPLELSNAEMRRVCEERCELILARLGLAGGVVDRVRNELLAEPSRFPDLDTVARALRMSARTLRRRLREEGASFRDVLADVRKSLALDYLERSTLSVAEIASLLGYEEPANFHRAFRKWTREGPGEYRAREAAARRATA